jgi:hypothetical protein
MLKILLVHFKSCIALDAYLLSEKHSHRAMFNEKVAHPRVFIALGG